MAPGVGIEPTIAESKSVVLPLHYPGIKIGRPTILLGGLAGLSRIGKFS